MSKSKIDQFLDQSKDGPSLLMALESGSTPHTEVAEQFQGLGASISEASVRRWRHTNHIDLIKNEACVPKILIWDIESSPIIGYTWGLYEQNVIGVIQDWKLLTVSWTWYGSGEYHAKQLCDFKGYKKGSLDDLLLTKFVRDLLDQADYSVAHNGNAFDVKKVNAKFAEHNIAPPSPHTQIDTLGVARRNMKMSSNKLDSLGAIFGLGRKINHSGFTLWTRCMAGERAAWEEMKEYAVQDVVLLEAVFERLLPWIKGLNYSLFTDEFVCKNCGSAQLSEQGHFISQTAARPAWACETCGTWNKKTTKGKTA